MCRSTHRKLWPERQLCRESCSAGDLVAISWTWCTIRHRWKRVGNGRHVHAIPPFATVVKNGRFLNVSCVLPQEPSMLAPDDEAIRDLFRLHAHNRRWRIRISHEIAIKYFNVLKVYFWGYMNSACIHCSTNHKSMNMQANYNNERGITIETQPLRISHLSRAYPRQPFSISRLSNTPATTVQMTNLSLAVQKKSSHSLITTFVHTSHPRLPRQFQFTSRFKVVWMLRNTFSAFLRTLTFLSIVS